MSGTGGLNLRITAQKLVTVSLMVGLTLTATTTACGGEYCKWTDENGVVHFDDKCPDNVASTIITTDGERTEGQIRAAEEHSKSLLSKPPRVIDSTGQTKDSESAIDTEGAAHEDAPGSVDLSRMSAQQLDVMCEKEREKRLAPEREQLIKVCVEDWRSSQDYCENYYSDYGAAQAIFGPGGEQVGVRPALYMDLPECIAAWEAKMNGN